MKTPTLSNDDEMVFEDGNFLPSELLPEETIMHGVLEYFEKIKTQFDPNTIRVLFRVVVKHKVYRVAYICSPYYSEDSKFGKLVTMIMGNLPERVKFGDIVKRTQDEGKVFEVRVSPRKYPTVTEIVGFVYRKDLVQDNLSNQNGSDDHLEVTPKPEQETIPATPPDTPPKTDRALYVNEPIGCYYCGKPMPTNPQLWTRKDIDGKTRILHPECRDKL